jgi:hypothetical protein
MIDMATSRFQWSLEWSSITMPWKASAYWILLLIKMNLKFTMYSYLIVAKDSSCCTVRDNRITFILYILLQSKCSQVYKSISQMNQWISKWMNEWINVILSLNIIQWFYFSKSFVWFLEKILEYFHKSCHFVWKKNVNETKMSV